MGVGHACGTTQVQARHHAEVGRRGQQGGKDTGDTMAAKGRQVGTGGIFFSHIHERPSGGYKVADREEAVPAVIEIIDGGIGWLGLCVITGVVLVGRMG